MLTQHRRPYSISPLQHAEPWVSTPMEHLFSLPAVARGTIDFQNPLLLMLSGLPIWQPWAVLPRILMRPWHCCAALDLIESEPMANALSGYTWWEAEGHGARVAAVAVNAACKLADLAVSARLFDLANWGLAQARLVDPYSEAISRSAMQVAAAAGDADQFRREWRECQRRIDELDPGGSPSPRTERLYGELSQRLFAHVSPGRED